MKLNVYNPTPYPRNEWVIFGSEAKTPHTFLSLPKSHLNVGKVLVPKSHIGEVNITTTEEPFKLNETILKNLMLGLSFYMMINGQKVVFGNTKTEVFDNRVVILKATAVHKNAITQLFVYIFNDQPTMRFELCVYAQSLVEAIKPLKASFHFDGGAKVIIKVYNGDPENLLNESIGDSQGRRWSGVMGFWDESFIPTQIQFVPEKTNTLFAQSTQPLYGLVKWTKWGLWGVKPPEFTQQEINQQFFSSLGQNYNNPFKWFGFIGNTYAGSAGNQSGFGPWQTIHTVGGYSPILLPLRDWQVGQEHCRPVSYFEENGERVKAKNHPGLVMWSQRINTRAGSNTLGRIHGSQGPGVGNWSGYDYQHDYSTCAHDNVILQGSFAMKDWLEGKNQAYISGLTLPLTGRSARACLALVYSYLATGNQEVIDHIADIFPKTKESARGLNNPAWKVRPSSTPGNFLPPNLAMLPYEEMKFVKGWDAVRLILAERPEAKQIEDMIYIVGSTVVLHGYHPVTNKSPFVLRWNNGQPWSLQQWNDPEWARGLGFSMYWSLPGIIITKRMATQRKDQPVIDRANTLINSVNKNNYEYKLYSGVQ